MRVIIKIGDTVQGFELIYTEVMKKILEHGHDVYIVGGFVRDFLMKRESFDVDIATSMPSQDVFELFIQYSDITHHQRYGSVHFSLPPYDIEITQFRQEKNYQQYRYPQKIRFVDSVYVDAKRRDLSINALYMDHKGQIFDPYNGIEDLKKGVLRMIEPIQRKFDEDHLRTVRILRLQSQLDFSIEKQTEKAMIMKPELTWSMKQDEIKKILEAPYFRSSLIFYQSYYENIFELDNFDLRLFSLPAYWPYRFLTLYRHDLEKMENILLQWHLPHMERKHLCAIAQATQYFEDDKLQEAWYQFDNLTFFDALNYWMYLEPQTQKDKLYLQIMQSPYRYLNELKIDGHDLKKWQIPAQKRQYVLKTVFWEVLTGETQNEKAALEEATRRALK